MGTHLPLHKKGADPPPFLTHVYCAQTAQLIKMPLGVKVGLGPGHIVLDGDPATLTRKGGKAAQFLGPCLLWRPRCRPTMVGLGSGNIVLDADPVPPPRGTDPQLSATSVVAKRLDGMKPRPRPHCATRGTAPPKGHSIAPAHDYCGQTVAHLSYS